MQKQKQQVIKEGIRYGKSTGKCAEIKRGRE